MKLTLECFHEDEFKAYPMKSYDLTELNRAIYTCPKCGREVIVKLEFDE